MYTFRDISKLVFIMCNRPLSTHVDKTVLSGIKIILFKDNNTY